MRPGRGGPGWWLAFRLAEMKSAGDFDEAKRMSGEQRRIRFVTDGQIGQERATIIPINSKPSC